jgi:hypothetical protein
MVNQFRTIREYMIAQYYDGMEALLAFSDSPLHLGHLGGPQRLRG